MHPGGPAVDLEPAAAEDAGLGARRGLDREAARLSYPTWLIELFAADMGQDEAFALAEAMNRRAPMAVRVNTGRITRDELALRLADEQVTSHPTPLSPDGLIFDTRVNAFALTAFQDGLFEVMDEGSQLVAELVAPPPGGRVADACAGAGGKTLAIGARLGGKGRMLALDTDGKKLEELRRRARRAGLTNLEARQVDQYGKPTGQNPPLRAGGFDRVLVDAPCSGLGTLRRNPEARWRLTRAAVEAFPGAATGAVDRLRTPVCGGRTAHLRDLHGRPRRERRRHRPLPGRARRLRPGAGQGDLGARARRAGG